MNDELQHALVVLIVLAAHVARELMARRRHRVRPRRRRIDASSPYGS